MADLPSWVWVLLSHVQEYEDYHAADATCLEDALNSVPEDMRAYGRAYIRGRAEALLEVTRRDKR